jgi:hypothetical protein
MNSLTTNSKKHLIMRKQFHYSVMVFMEKPKIQNQQNKFQLHQEIKKKRKQLSQNHLDQRLQNKLLALIIKETKHQQQ